MYVILGLIVQRVAIPCFPLDECLNHLLVDSAINSLNYQNLNIYCLYVHLISMSEVDFYFHYRNCRSSVSGVPYKYQYD